MCSKSTSSHWPIDRAAKNNPQIPMIPQHHVWRALAVDACKENLQRGASHRGFTNALFWLAERDGHLRLLLLL